MLLSYVGSVTCPGSMSSNNNGCGDELSMMLEHVIRRRRYRLVSMSQYVQSFREGFFHRNKSCARGQDSLPIPRS